METPLSQIAKFLNKTVYKLSDEELADADFQGRAAFESWYAKATVKQAANRINRHNANRIITSKQDITELDKEAVRQDFIKGAKAELAMLGKLSHLGPIDYNDNQETQSTNYWDIASLGCKIDVKVFDKHDEFDRTTVSFNSFSKIANPYGATSDVAVLICMIINNTVKPMMLISRDALRKTLRVSKHEEAYREFSLKLVSELLHQDPFARDFKVVILAQASATKFYHENGLWALDEALMIKR